MFTLVGELPKHQYVWVDLADLEFDAAKEAADEGRREADNKVPAASTPDLRVA